MTAKVIEFPNKPESLDELVDQLKEAVPLIGAMSVVIQDRDSGVCHVFSYNMDAASLAFHALLLQQESINAGDIHHD